MKKSTWFAVGAAVCTAVAFGTVPSALFYGWFFAIFSPLLAYEAGAWNALEKQRAVSAPIPQAR